MWRAAECRLWPGCPCRRSAARAAAAPPAIDASHPLPPHPVSPCLHCLAGRGHLWRAVLHGGAAACRAAGAPRAQRGVPRAPGGRARGSPVRACVCAFVWRGAAVLVCGVCVWSACPLQNACPLRQARDAWHATPPMRALPPPRQVRDALHDFHASNYTSCLNHLNRLRRVRGPQGLCCSALRVCARVEEGWAPRPLEQCPRSPRHTAVP